MLGFHQDGQTLGLAKPLNFIGQDHHRLFLDVGTGEHPVSHAGKLGQANHPITGLDADPAVAQDWYEVVGAS